MKHLSHQALIYFSLLALPAAAQQTSSTNGTEVLETVEVQGKKDTSSTENYTAPTESSSGLKINAPLLETSQAISVISEGYIQDRDTHDLEQVLTQSAGVSVGGYYDGWDYYRIRGFDASFNTFWDGLRGDYGRSVELFGLEKVEVIKGPASSLYGQGPMGGLVNVVSKRPKDETFGSISVGAGSWNAWETSADAGTVFNEDKSIYGRIVALYRTEDSFVDYANQERYYIAPSLTWEISRDTKLTFLSSFQYDEGTLAMPLPAAGTILDNPAGNISTDLFIGAPGFSGFDQWLGRIGYELEHQFNDVFSLRQNLSYSRMRQVWNDTLYPASLSSDGTTLYTYPYDYHEMLDRIGVDTAIDAKFDTGRIKHTFTVGTDFYFTHSDSGSKQIDYSDFPGSYVPIDLFNPVYPSTMPNYASVYSSVEENTMLGIYFQDHAKLTDTVTLTAGGRLDRLENESAGDKNSQSAFSPKIGSTWEFTPGAAVYANYGHAFQPQWSSKDVNGNSVDPSEGDNFEGGIKFNTEDQRLTGMISAFHLTRQNVATSNLATADPYDSVVTGEQRSQGIELEGAAQPIDGLKLTAAYTWTDAEVTKDNSLEKGTRLMGVPENSFNVWAKYVIQSGTLKGLGAGIGGRYYTNQAGDQQDSFKLPAYGLLDAALYYEQERYRVQVNFNNLTDEEYYAGSYNNLYVLPGKPFNVSAKITWIF